MRFFLVFLTGILPLFLFSQLDDTKWKSIHLLFAGDIMGHDPQIESAAIVKDSLYDYTPCFEYISPVLQKSDLSIGNLELTLPGKAPYTGYPTFKSPDELALALRYAGFDFLVTANNHSNDAHKTGLVNTISTLDDYHFYHTGTFRNAKEKSAYYPLIIYKNGFKFIFLNYTYGTNGIKTKPPSIVNMIDEEAIEKDMEIARQLEGDAIIVIMHWGHEYHTSESPEQRKLAAKIFNWGADLLVGAHPHVVQPIKVYSEQTDSTKKKVVAYSLGNFISNQKRKETDGGIMLEVEFRKNIEDGEVHLSDHHFIPVWRYRKKDEAGNITFLTLPVSAFESDENNSLGLPTADQAAMINYAGIVRKRLKAFKCPERKISLTEILPEEIVSE